MKKLFCLATLLSAVTSAPAMMFVGPWTPMFQGVDHAVGTNFPSTVVTNNGVALMNATLQVVHCVRVDLTDPGVRLFATPPAPGYIANYRETLSLSISNFIRSYGVQVAANANYYYVNPGGSDPSAEGLPSDNEGLLISNGQVVSSDGVRLVSLLFTTNNTPVLNLDSRPPNTNTAGIFTAVAGYYPVLTNGVNLWAFYANSLSAFYTPGDTTIHQLQPRTVFGISQDRRYLFLMTVDGRQGGYSNGALDVDMGMWMLQFGAWDAVNMDGGGTTAMYSTDGAGNPVPLNHSSYVAGAGRERIVGNHFGVYAAALPGSDVKLVFGLTNGWKYTTTNLDGVNWQAPAYDDSTWSGPGPGVLWTDSAHPIGGNTAIQFLPLGTQMPLNTNVSPALPYLTYYFRTHFTYADRLAGIKLTFSNYLDDGAAFYLNGVEINRAFLPKPATNSAVATNYNCHPSGNATCPYVFDIAGDLATNLHCGDNVLSVEVHNYSVGSPDMTFGSALLYLLPPPPPPFFCNLVVVPAETSAAITWTTLSNATAQVSYGLGTNLDQVTALDATLSTNHSITLTGLQPSGDYSFVLVGTGGGDTYTTNGSFSTLAFYASLVSLENSWTYTTNNLDGVPWQQPSYDDSAFLGQGPALLHVETNPDVYPRVTPLPATADGLPFLTYYFRTHFICNTNPAGLALIFTNYIDDGAMLYLNGTELQRVRMPPSPQPVTYVDLAVGCPPVNCDAVASAPDVFRISGDLMTNLVVGGDNVLAAEVHQRSAGSSDIVFGSVVGLVPLLISETTLRITRSGLVTTVAWDGSGFTLQQASSLDSKVWTDVPGPLKTSPYSVTNSAAETFYRLRN